MEPLWPPPPALARRVAPPAPQALREGDRPFAWFVEVFLYPDRFFGERLQSVGAWLTTPKVVLLIVIIGLERVVDQQDRLQRLLNLDGFWQSTAMQAVALLVWVPLAGTLAYHIGKFWYRMRLLFCGARADYDRLTSVFAVRSGAWSVPAVAVGLPALVLGVPVEQTFWFMISTAGWITYVDYVAVRTAFGAGRRRAMFWFVIAPAAMLTAIFAFAFFKALG